jgi:rare lipoprotein A
MLRPTELVAASLLKSAMIAMCATLSIPACAAASKARHSQHLMTGQASYYRHGQVTASGERFNPGALTAAHRTLPFGTRVVVKNLRTNKHVTVRINDRGPFIKGRIVDLSFAAARAIDMTHSGTATVSMAVVE